MSAFFLSLMLLAGAAQVGEADVRAKSNVRRFALIAAANDGGDGRVQLRHANEDAHGFAAVLAELGGVAKTDVIVAVDADLASLEHALAALDTRAREAKDAGARVEVIVYYSGHSDAEGLLLASERYPYAALRSAIENIDADVRIAVLDSCLSGAMIRQKGGTHLPPFLLDESSRVKGTAVLTSSSRDEVAQESDAFSGSFFTHALVSGLRGAADASGDGLVTLDEAYRFAFHETLRRTETVQGTAQHPAYDMRLSGSGDLVLTDLREVEAGLVLGDDVSGRVSVRDNAGRLVVELQKPAGSPMLLGLPAGAYAVRVADRGATREGAVTLVEGQRTALLLDGLETLALDPVRARGGAVVEPVFPVNLALVPPLELNSFFEGSARNYLGLHLLAGRQRSLTGVDLALGGSFVHEDAYGLMVGLLGNVVGGDMWGAQVGLLGNVTVGDHYGLQLAVASNVAVGDVVVGQLSSGVNVGLGSTRGFALGLGNVHNRVEGVQLGLVNVARSVAGVQLALVNVADDVAGPQIALINVANDVKGPQIALLNVARRSPASIGLLSFVLEGIHHAGFFATDFTPVGARVQLGGAHVYTAVHAGLSPFWVADDWAATLALSVGGRARYDVMGTELYADFEIGAGEIPRPMSDFFGDGGLSLDTFARAMIGWRPLPFVTVAAGPALHVLVYERGVIDPTRFPLQATIDSPVSTTFAPGFALYLGL